MSHVVTIDMSILDLESLKDAAAELGLYFVKKPNFRWYMKHVGDFPLPVGFTAEDMGKCEYAIGIPNNKQAYEVGVVKRRDGKPGYTLMFDFWSGGLGLLEAIGGAAGKLKREYAIQVGIKEMRRKGFKARRELHAVSKKPIMRATKRG